MRAVLKIGGSLLYDAEGEILTDKIREYTTVIKSLIQENHSLVIIVGGGRPARTFITAARELGASEAQCDWLGIKLARNNAELFCAALGQLAYPKIVETLDELETAILHGKVVLMGGLIPGQSTNAVAAVVAETIHAEMIFNATNVDGVYDRDPKKDGAILLDNITINQLTDILSGSGTKAGEYKLFDPIAIRVVARSKIPTTIFNGSNPENITRAFHGEKIGTHIIHDNKR